MRGQRHGREAGYVLQAVEAWLRDGRPPGTVLEDFDEPEPKLGKNESIHDAIERLRRRGRELKADLHRIRSAPFPSEGGGERNRAFEPGNARWQVAARGINGGDRRPGPGCGSA